MSCYKFAPGTFPNTFVFPTDRGWWYSVFFPSQSGTFVTHPMLENGGLFFEIVFERSPLDKPIRGRDSLVEVTILTIIRQQLQGQGVLPIYYFVCDMEDKKEAARAKLFALWYETCDLEGWEMVNYELQMPDGSRPFYAGLFVHTDHPNSAQIPDAF